MNKYPLIAISIFISTLVTSGCASNSNTTQVYAPNEQLNDILINYTKVTPIKPKCQELQAKHCRLTSTNGAQKNTACHFKRQALKHCQSQEASEPKLVLNLNCHDNSKKTIDCYRLASELNALTMQYPNNKRIMMATALVEFELGNTTSSQNLLDNILSKRGAYPEAAILRSRIAMEEGNLTLARSLVKKQLSITPDNPYLYEMQASYYYIEGKYTEALQSVKIAERFMEPNWRIAHHRGLIYEAQEQWYKACKEYQQILQVEPNNRVIKAKINLLYEHIDCYVKYNNNPFD